VRWALLIFGAMNAILYAGLTPLWEGFDEPFHYGYVQHLRSAHSLPVQRQTPLSEEVWRSFPLAPASYIVQRNLPMVTTFDDWFRLPPEGRRSRRRQLEQLDPTLASVPSNAPNYESQQAPLAYALIAPFDRLWADASLPVRVWRLRLLGVLVSSLASGVLLFQLGGLLSLDERSRLTAVFLLFASQMFYATTAHVANDWLALPLFLLVLNAGLSLYAKPSRSAALLLGIALATGLLTKAYFLALIPFALGVVLFRCGWRDRILFAAVALVPPAPWYIRNLSLYGDLAGQQENLGGTPVRALWNTAFRLPWAQSLLATAKSSLWEGNSSATTFGYVTIWLMLAVLAAAVVCYLRKAPPPIERVLLAGMFCYGAALAYNNVLQYLFTKGAGITPAPWYVELLEAPALCLLLAGLARAGTAGRIIRVAWCWLWAYVISATYVAKLIPMYGGYAGRPVRFLEIARWYASSLPQIGEVLAHTALISPAAIFALTVCVVIAAFALAWRLTW
jgi:hypothetical protein